MKHFSTVIILVLTSVIAFCDYSSAQFQQLELSNENEVRNLQVLENATVDTVLGIAYFEGNTGQVTARVKSVEVENIPIAESVVGFNILDESTLSIILTSHTLDWSRISQYTIKWTYQDYVSPVEVEFITTLRVIDVNDNAPVWQAVIPSGKIEVNETEPIGTFIFLSSASDIDYYKGAYVNYFFSETTETAGYFNYTYPSFSKNVSIYLNKQLDYQERSIHEVTLIAKDGGGDQVYCEQYTPSGDCNETPMTVFVYVNDIPNKPPLFTHLPYITAIEENEPQGEVVFKVTAEDQDTGYPLPLVFSIVSVVPALRSHFSIDSTTGEITIAEEMDREDLLTEYDTDRIEITVLVEKNTTVDEWKDSATAVVYITLEDINDNTPAFGHEFYNGSVLENSPANIFVTIDDPEDISVFDYDNAENGTFHVEIADTCISCTECDCALAREMFYVEPSSVKNQATLLLKVLNRNLLDYQLTTDVSFEIIAQETSTPEQRNSSVKIRVDLIDTNDNYPQFSEKSYTVEVPEYSEPGTFVLSVTATDADSGDYGVVYYSILGRGYELFNMDEISGNLTVAGELDRLIDDNYYLTVYATDEKGNGNRNSTDVQIIITDINNRAPEFFDEYEEFIKEDKTTPPTFRRAFIVQATDDDLPPNSDISYFFLDDSGVVMALSPGGNFSIDESSGEILAITPVSYEEMDEETFNEVDWYRHFNLTVIAIDHGDPPLNGTTNVMIYVEDVNDNSPVFEKNVYEGEVREDDVSSTFVVQVKADDKDPTELNGQVTYRVIAGGIDKFEADSESGNITIATHANLDLVANNFVDYYSLTVLAVDAGLPQQQGTTTVNVTVIDVNNKSPSFNQSVYDAEVVENSDVDSYVMQMIATDPDRDHQLQYRLHSYLEGRDENNGLVDPEVYNEWLDILLLNGTVIVNGTINREAVESIRLIIRVEDVNAEAAYAPQYADATVYLTVIDVNDNAPVFQEPWTEQQPLFNISVPEGITKGMLLMTLRAVDPDKGDNGTVRFKIVEAEELGWEDLVTVDEMSGELRVNGIIDYDCDGCDIISFTMMAYDLGTPSLNTTAPFYIHVIDQNDNFPVIHNVNDSYDVHAEILEDADIGEFVFWVNATNKDSGDFGVNGFFVDQAYGKQFNFTDVESGNLLVNGQLDRETNDRYELFVQVKDNYKESFDSNSVYTTIRVLLLDVNDQAPIFELIEMPHYLPETTTEGELLLTVRANDADDPTTDNAIVSYYIDPDLGNGTEYFTIETKGNWDTSRIGEIRTRSSLIGRYGIYTIVVIAQDHGDPRLSSNVTIEFFIEDVNLNKPVWQPPTPTDTVKKYIDELSPGSVAFQVYAVDSEDHGENAEVQYRILENGHHTYFNLVSCPGVCDVTVAKELDEIYYYVQVEARDCPSCEADGQLSIERNITIRVVYDELEIPTFDRSDVPPDLELAEHTAVPYILDKSGNLPPASYIDDEVDDSICYDVVGGDTSNQFRADAVGDGKERWNLTNIVELDREVTENYALVIQSRNCRATVNTREIPYDPADLTLIQVNVKVLDINDQPPVFDLQLYEAGMTSDYKLDMLVTDQIKATSSDLPPFNSITYSIVEDSWNFDELNYDYEAETSLAPFRIDPITGELYLNHEPRQDGAGIIKFKVQAVDDPTPPGPHSATSDVWVYLVSEVNQLRFVSALTKDEFRAVQQDFIDELTRLIDAETIVDSVTNYVDENDEVSATLISIYSHFVKDGEIAEADVIYDILKQNDEELNPFYEEFRITGVQRVYEEEVITVDQSQSYLIALVISVVVFCLIIVILLAVWYNETQKYKRKLRAANAMNFGETMEVDLNTLKTPNTNKYAYEGSNPIWMEQDYENPGFEEHEAEEDSISQNSLDENNIVDEDKLEYNKTPLDGVDRLNVDDVKLRNNLNFLYNKSGGDVNNYVTNNGLQHQYEDPEVLQTPKLPTSYL